MNSNTAKIEKIKAEINNAYEKIGQATAFEVANKYDNEIEWEHCPAHACDTTTPTIKGQHTCLICFTKTTPLENFEEPEQRKEPTDTMPLWKRLNENRTQGEWKLPEQEQSMNQYTVITNDMTIADILAIDIPDEEGYANAQYTAICVNHFAYIVEALEGLMQHLEWREDFIIEDANEGEENAYSKAKEIIKKIS